MSELLDKLLGGNPKEENPSEVKPKEEKPSEVKPKEEKPKDWRSVLPDTLISEVSDYETLDAFVTAFKNMKASKGLSPEDTFDPGWRVDKQVEWLKNNVKVDEKGYENFENEGLRDLYKDLGISPEIALHLENKRGDIDKKSSEELELLKVSKYKEEINKMDKEALGRDLHVVLNKVGITPEDFKENFGSESLNPKLLSFIQKVSKAVTAESKVDVTEPETNKPAFTDPRVLRQKQADIIDQMAVTNDPILQLKLQKQLSDLGKEELKSYKAETRRKEVLDW